MLYFAYGSNMDPLQMRQRCPGARAMGAARLADHRLAFTRESRWWGGGVASVEPHPGDEVWGVLWELTDADERSLDAYEGVDAGAYRTAVVLVEHGGRPATAMVYVAVPHRPKPPSRRYLEGILRGARAHDLPPEYLARLEALGPVSG